MEPLNVVVGAAVAAVIALLGFRARALTRGGALAAFAVGTGTYAAGGPAFAMVLLAFFVPSVLLSRLGKQRKLALIDIGKGGARDALQVLANGGIATLCALAFAFAHDARWGFAFGGAYAAATADTWGTEIGTLAKAAPRSILTLRPVATGLSGGITLPGTLAEIAGALWIGLVTPVALLFALGGYSMPTADWLRTVIVLLSAVPIAGVAGATLDSVLGATVQELRHCDACDRPCETNPHDCGAATRRIRGLSGASNDWVNLAATLTGAAVAFALT